MGCMKTISVETKLKKLQDRKSAITANMQKLEASAKVVARKRGLQKKILVGTYFLEQANKNGTMDELKTAMMESLKRTSDRRLFEDEQANASKTAKV